MQNAREHTKSLISLHKNLKATPCALVHTHACTFRPIYPVSHPPPHTYRFTHIRHHTDAHTDTCLATCLFVFTKNPCTCGLFSMETYTPHINSPDTKPSIKHAHTSRRHSHSFSVSPSLYTSTLKWLTYSHQLIQPTRIVIETLTLILLDTPTHIHATLVRTLKSIRVCMCVYIHKTHLKN